MSYSVIDVNGRGADFASNQGLRDLEGLGLPHLSRFLETGQCEEGDRVAIMNEVRGNSLAAYIKPIFSKLKGPLVLTDGIGEDEDYVED